MFGASFPSLHLQCHGSPRCGCVWIGILLAGQCIFSAESVQRRGCYMDVVGFKKCLKTCLKGPIIFRVSFSFPQRPKRSCCCNYHKILPHVSFHKLLRTPVLCGRGPCLPTSFWNWMRSGLPKLNEVSKVGTDTTWWFAGSVWRASRWRPLRFTWRKLGRGVCLQYLSHRKYHC